MTSPDNPEGGRDLVTRPRGQPYRNVGTARSVSLLGTGMIIGAVIGAGIALLVAPHSGSETRRVLSRRASRLRGNRGVWSKLGRELRRAAAARAKAAELEARRKAVRLRDAEPGTP